MPDGAVDLSLPGEDHPYLRAFAIGLVAPIIAPIVLPGLVGTRSGRALLRRELGFSGNQPPRSQAASEVRVADEDVLFQESAVSLPSTAPGDEVQPQAGGSGRRERHLIKPSTIRSVSGSVAAWLGTLLTLTLAGILAAIIYGYMSSH